MNTNEWEELNEDESRFAEALRQIGAETPVSPDFCARVLAAARQLPPTSAAAERTAAAGAGRSSHRFRLSARLGPALSVLAAGLVLSLAANVWLTFRLQDMATLRHELATVQAQVRAAAAQQRQWQPQRQRQPTEGLEGAPVPDTRLPEAVQSIQPTAAPTEVDGQLQAKIGYQIRSGRQTAPKAGDFFRVYAEPAEDAYVYVVHNDGKILTLLNAQDANTKVQKGSQLTFPAPDRFYQIDEANDQESITVICSATELREVTDLFQTTNVSQTQWAALEERLMEQSMTSLTRQLPISLKVRPRPIRGEPFMDN